jgi:HEAT repeat protein
LGGNFNEREAKILLPPLLKLANKPKLRISAIRAVAALGLNNPEALALLINCLKPEEAPEICDEAARQIGCLWGPKGKTAVPALIKVLEDQRKTSGEIQIRFTAAIALGKIGPPAASAVPKLMEWVKEERSLTLRLEIARILGKIDFYSGLQAQAILEQELEIKRQGPNKAPNIP